jgi:hypothetical protein
MAPASEQPSAPQFPAWPLNCLSFYSHMAGDYGRFVQSLGAVTDPAQAARAEGDYGVSVMHDMMQAWYDLALSPWAAMVKASAPTAGQAPVEDKPAKSA